MKRIASLLALALLTGCAAQPASDKPVVVVTTNILGDVVSELVGDQAEVITLMPPDSDPHSFEISAIDAARMAQADLLVSNGLGLEEGLQHHVDSAVADGVRAVAAGEFVSVIHYSSGESDGDIDPHFWTDPQRMIAVVDGLESELAAIDGIDRDALASTTGDYRDELEKLDAELVASFGDIPDDRRALVTNHHVFGYLAERFNFRVLGAVIPSGTTLAAPSASDLRELVTAIRGARVSTIFADASQPERLIQVLADEANVDVAVVALYTESLTAPGGEADTYLTMMRTNERLITTGLSS